MKGGELRKVAQAYGGCLPEPWRRVGNAFIRFTGDWAHIVAFNPSRFAEQYIPRSCMEFLKMPGVPTGGFLPQELHNPKGTQRWVKTTEMPTKVFEEMIRQFKPELLSPLNVDEVKSMLFSSLDYWPHAYALCVMACEANNLPDAEFSFNAFASATADKHFPWVESRRQELTECIKLIGSPGTLRMNLETIQVEKLRALKLAS